MSMPKAGEGENMIKSLILSASKDGSIIGIYVMIALIAAVFVYLFIKFCGNSIKESIARKKVFNNPESVTKTATFARIKYSHGSSSMVNGVPVSGRSYFTVYVRCTDMYGGSEVIQLSQKYSDLQVKYLRCIHEFPIKTYKKWALVAIDLSNPIVTDDMLLEAQKYQDETKEKDIPLANGTTTLFCAILAFIFALCALGAGIGGCITLIDNNNIVGGVCNLVFCFVLAVFIAIVGYQFMFKRWYAYRNGTPASGFLVDVTTRGSSRYTMMYAVVNANDQTKKVFIESPELYMYLQSYVGKNIPIKIWKNTVAIDYKRLYSNSKDWLGD